ncbi:hypothetical protein BG46_10890 [Brucella anthropi]|uniref:hypothetical protein n=1 Tax=Brucella anthropi TaxID=529 RepID=UPI00045006A8|nr:hypothetical protein [Brucella anthropi]EXL07809.1 hypothetical protein BG46_10890 [Brucella anthropi]RRY13352.1 hypothetical protein EGJ58_03355 [Brucella anthropi]
MNPPLMIINHNPTALSLHGANHPQAPLLGEKIYNIVPLDYLPSTHIGLSAFSPDCKHFSKPGSRGKKGGAL